MAGIDGGDPEMMQIYDMLLEKNQFVKAVYFLDEIGWLPKDQFDEALASAKRMEGKED